METDLTKAAETARLKGILAGKGLAKGLKSTDPERRAAAEAMRKTVTDRLFALENDVPSIAHKSGVSYADALAATKAAVAIAGGKLSKAAKDKLIMDLKQAGTNVALGWAAGIDSANALHAARTAAKNLADAAGVFLHGNSPPPVGPLHTIDKGGENVGIAWGDGLLKSIGRISTTMRGVLDGSSAALGAASPAFAPTFGTAVAATPGMASTSARTIIDQRVYSYSYPQTIQVEGLVNARDPFEIATQARRLREFGQPKPPAFPKSGLGR